MIILWILSIILLIIYTYCPSGRLLVQYNISYIYSNLGLHSAVTFPSQQLDYFHLKKTSKLDCHDDRRGAGKFFILWIGVKFFSVGFKVTTGFLICFIIWLCIFPCNSPLHAQLLLSEKWFSDDTTLRMCFLAKKKYLDKYAIHWRTTHRGKYWKVCSVMWKSIRFFPLSQSKKKEMLMYNCSVVCGIS